MNTNRDHRGNAGQCSKHFKQHQQNTEKNSLGENKGLYESLYKLVRDCKHIYLTWAQIQTATMEQLESNQTNELVLTGQ